MKTLVVFNLKPSVTHCPSLKSERCCFKSLALADATVATRRPGLNVNFTLYPKALPGATVNSK